MAQQPVVAGESDKPIEIQIKELSESLCCVFLLEDIFHFIAVRYRVYPEVIVID
jgi:hypothetical protein